MLKDDPSLYRPQCRIVAPDEDENPITGKYMMGEHLGSPLQFLHLEFVLLFDIFINLYW